MPRTIAQPVDQPLWYGVYDLHANTGTLFVGTSDDTPGFAVDWVEERPSIVTR